LSPFGPLSAPIDFARFTVFGFAFVVDLACLSGEQRRILICGVQATRPITNLVRVLGATPAERCRANADRYLEVMRRASASAIGSVPRDPA
jgi:hypothetical protein